MLGSLAKTFACSRSLFGQEFAGSRDLEEFELAAGITLADSQPASLRLRGWLLSGFRRFGSLSGDVFFQSAPPRPTELTFNCNKWALLFFHVSIRSFEWPCLKASSIVFSFSLVTVAFRGLFDLCSAQLNWVVAIVRGGYNTIDSLAGDSVRSQAGKLQVVGPLFECCREVSLPVDHHQCLGRRASIDQHGLVFLDSRMLAGVSFDVIPVLPLGLRQRGFRRSHHGDGIPTSDGACHSVHNAQTSVGQSNPRT